MKVGIFTFRQKPYISANVSIAYEVGISLKAQGFDVCFIGCLQDSCQKKVTEYDGIPIYFLNDSPIIEKHSVVVNKIASVFGEQIHFKKESNKLSYLVDKLKIDILITVIAPINTILIAEQARLKIPIILYQLDPYYNVGDEENHKLKKRFISHVKHCSHLLTTDLLHDIYIKDENLSQFKSKMTVVQFPKLSLDTYNSISNKNSNGNKVSILYAGSLYRTIRNPKILEDFFNLIPVETELIFMGGCDHKEDFQRLNETSIVCKGFCPQDEVISAIDEAGFLLNIGNLVHNQLGSKLIDYISTGKPIINIYQFNECPTLSILSQYDYAFNVSIDDLTKPTTKVKLREFINRTIGHRMNYADILNKYESYSPEYVGKHIYNQIYIELGGKNE